MGHERVLDGLGIYIHLFILNDIGNISVYAYYICTVSDLTPISLFSRLETRPSRVDTSNTTSRHTLILMRERCKPIISLFDSSRNTHCLIIEYIFRRKYQILNSKKHCCLSINKKILITKGWRVSEIVRPRQVLKFHDAAPSVQSKPDACVTGLFFQSRFGIVYPAVALEILDKKREC